MRGLSGGTLGDCKIIHMFWREAHEERTESQNVKTVQKWVGHVRCQHKLEFQLSLIEKGIRLCLYHLKLDKRMTHRCDRIENDVCSGDA
jgi:hypothetical protein